MTGWTAIVPAQRWVLANSRLELGPEHRVDLARAFSLDLYAVLDQVDAIEHLIVVTGEAELAAIARRHGHTVIEDRPLMSVDPLNDAIRRGQSWALARRSTTPIVVIPADLPALDVPSLAGALQQFDGPGASYVPDSAGTGTTLLAAPSPSMLHPRYGLGSARRHATAGARAVIDVDARVRRDVDTIGHLREAMAMGMGLLSTAAARLATEEQPVQRVEWRFLRASTAALTR